MAAPNCVWSDIFDHQARVNLDVGYIATGVISSLLGVWLNLALLLTNLRSDLSYRNLAFFTVISVLRRAVSVFYSPFNYTKSSESGPEDVSCDVSGFWESFWAVYEVECLTHVCIERYVIAKYTTKGWTIQKNHYILYQGLCIFFSALYSIPPLIGIGRYGLDFTCQSCVLDMVLQVSWHRYVVVAIFLLRSVKSTGFMITMLVWARNLEAKYDGSEKLVKEKHFTESAVMITIVNLVCWLPIASIRGWMVLSYLLFNGVHVKPSATSIQWAIWLHWAAPAFTTIAIFLIDERLYNKMVLLWKGEEKKEKLNKND